MLLGLSYTPSIKLNFLSLSQPKVDESNEFLPWLERKAGAEISSALSIGKSAYGTVLFASKSITRWRLRFEGSVRRATSSG
ncbi:hypothetical protein EV2_001225 [Malus domestica]